MGEQGMSYHVRGASTEVLTELLAQLLMPSVILDTENNQYLPFVTSVEWEALKKLIPFPLLQYSFHDDYGFWINGYSNEQKIFSIIVDWGGEIGHIWQPGDPDINSQKFERTSDKKLIEIGFFDSPQEIANLAGVVENFTCYDDGLTKREYEREDFDWVAWSKAHFAHEYIIPLTLGLTGFFNVDCSPYWRFEIEDFLDDDMYPNHLLISSQPRA